MPTLLLLLLQSSVCEEFCTELGGAVGILRVRSKGCSLLETDGVEIDVKVTTPSTFSLHPLPTPLLPPADVTTPGRDARHSAGRVNAVPTVGLEATPGPSPGP